MSDRILQAVCPDCGHVKPSVFDGTDCDRCLGVYEKTYYYNENDLRELVEQWSDKTVLDTTKEVQAENRVYNKCADELEELLE